MNAESVHGVLFVITVRAVKRRGWISPSRPLSLRFGRELVFFILEEHVERGERPVTTGNVLLHLDFLTIRKVGVAVDLLFEDAQLIPDTHQLVKKDL